MEEYLSGNGEISLNDYSAKAGGVAARVISLTDSPFTEVGHSFLKVYINLWKITMD